MSKQQQQEEAEHVRIVGLTVENVKRISAVDIKPDPKDNVVIIGGRNAQGKSTLLDSVQYVMGGKRSIPKDPVKHGAEEGNIVAKLSNGLIVKRQLKPSGVSELVITNEAGAKYSSPQTILDKMYGSLTFDPAAFSNMDKAKRLESVRQITGLDFTSHDRDRQAVFNQRRDVNREAEQLKARVSSMPRAESVEAVDVAALAQEMITENDKVANIAILNKQADTCQERCITNADKLRDLKESLAEAEKYQLELDMVYTNKLREIKEAEANFNAARAHALNAELANAESINAQVRSNEARAAMEDQLEEVETKAGFLTSRIEAMDEEKRAAIEAAHLPVEGLTFTDEDVFYNGVVFDECSGAERLRVSVAMGAAANPSLRVLLIRDGSLLDDENMVLLAELAKAHDLQVWIERVGDGDESAIIIEDGMVSSK